MNFAPWVKKILFRRNQSLINFFDTTGRQLAFSTPKTTSTGSYQENF